MNIVETYTRIIPFKETAAGDIIKNPKTGNVCLCLCDSVSNDIYTEDIWCVTIEDGCCEEIDSEEKVFLYPKAALVLGGA